MASIQAGDFITTFKIEPETQEGTLFGTSARVLKVSGENNELLTVENKWGYVVNITVDDVFSHEQGNSNAYNPKPYNDSCQKRQTFHTSGPSPACDC